MIDLHTHILFSVDDGCKNIEKTIEMLKEAALNGYKIICLTPHYIENSQYNSTVKENKIIFDKIKKRIKQEKIKIEVVLGNEVYISNNILKNLEEAKITTINKSRYLLIELPVLFELNNFKNILFEFQTNNITPIIAHPERYHYFQKDINKLIEIINLGALTQINSGSLFGDYGKKVKKTAKLMLKHDMVYFISTDAHSNKKNYERTDSLIKYLIKKNYDYENLLKKGPLKVVENKIIKKKQLNKVKKGFQLFKKM